MALGAPPVLRFLHKLNEVEATRTLPDRELLRRFADRRDEAAFRALVCRHGPTVLRVCLRILHSEHDAEDALQATFLVLAQRAASVGPLESVGGWLFGVASRLGRKMKTTSARRRAREGRAAEKPAADPVAEISLREAQEILDQELARLPGKYQLPLILCCLEGLTRDEAAQRLGLPVRTLKSRLERARELLRLRLASRGLAFSGALLASVFCGQRASASLPATLVDPTVRAASLVAAGQSATSEVSAEVAALTEGVTRTMFLSKLNIATVVLVGTALLLGLAAAVPWALAQTAADRPANKPAATPRAAEPAGKKAGWTVTSTIKHEHSVNIVACGPEWSAAGDEGGNLFAWETKTGKARKLMLQGGKGEGLTTSVDRLQFTPDGKYLYGILNGGRMLFRFGLQKADERAPGLGGQNPTKLGVSADGETWLESYSARVLTLRPNVMTPGSRGAVEYKTIEYEADIKHAVTSPDDKWLAVVTEDGNVHVHELESRRETQTIFVGGKDRKVTGVRFSPDGKRIAVVGDDALGHVYDATNAKAVAALKGHRGIIFAVAFSPDGKQVATGGDDNTARVWDAATGKELAVLEGHTDSVLSVAFTPDGERVVTGSADKTVRIWSRPR
jgi:RNA polymerase sigma factor (sigma-70 family)